MKSIFKGLMMVCVMAVASPVVAQTADGETGLMMTYLGAAGWIIKDGDVTVLVDPYISRHPYSDSSHADDDRQAYNRDEVAPPNEALIDGIVTEADFILIHHGHFDHLGDVPYIARQTGAKVIATETVIMILRAYGIPNAQLYAVGGGEDYQFDNFSVRVVPGIHSALGEKHYHDTRRYDRNTELTAPLPINMFIEGGSLSFLARFKDHTVLTMGSMNFLEQEMDGLNPDILLAGINGSRLGLYKYDERLLRSTGNPPVIIPTHWDSFTFPYSFSQEANVKSKLIPFRETVATLSPDTQVIIPVHLEPFVVDVIEINSEDVR